MIQCDIECAMKIIHAVKEYDVLMDGIIRYLGEINILLWALGLLLFHGLLYFILGTPNWFGVTLIASGTWVVGLLVLKAVSRAKLREKD